MTPTRTTGFGFPFDPETERVLAELNAEDNNCSSSNGRRPAPQPSPQRAISPTQPLQREGSQGIQATIPDEAHDHGQLGHGLLGVGQMGGATQGLPMLCRRR